MYTRMKVNSKKTFKTSLCIPHHTKQTEMHQLYITCCKMCTSDRQPAMLLLGCSHANTMLLSTSQPDYMHRYVSPDKGQLCQEPTNQHYCAINSVYIVNIRSSEAISLYYQFAKVLYYNFQSQLLQRFLQSTGASFCLHRREITYLREVIYRFQQLVFKLLKATVNLSIYYLLKTEFLKRTGK